MKVTITEKGTEYLREFMYDALSESRSDLFHNRHLSLPKSHMQTYSRRELATLLMKSNTNPLTGRRNNARTIVTQFLDSIIPAMATSNPPKKVSIKMPRITVSPGFKEKYTKDSTLPTLTRMQENTQGINEYPTKKEEEERLCKTLLRFHRDKTPQRLRQVEHIATDLLAKSLKRKKLLLLKRENENKREKSARSIVGKYDEKLHQEATTLINKMKPLVEERIEKPTMKERYKGRVQTKYLKQMELWQKRKWIHELPVPMTKKPSIPILKANLF